MKFPVIKENHLFLKVYERGRGYVSDGLAVYVLRNRNKDVTAVGFTVSKNRGNAVLRNTVRRRMRDAYRILYPFIKKGYLIVIVARQSCINYNSTELCEQLHASFRKAALFL
ncbi:MAG: ribonuclease P protein component [Clostridia bacterium]|nr:ribonuclease P protein component [Clostridia bacterium]